jgi:hypothetical protein
MTCGASANTASSPAPRTRRCQVTDISPETVSDGSLATNSTGSPALPRPLAPPGRRTAGPQQVAHTLGPLPRFASTALCHALVRRSGTSGKVSVSGVSRGTVWPPRITATRRTPTTPSPQYRFPHTPLP